MNRKLLAVLALAAFAATPAAASAQISTGISVAAGLSMPAGDFKSGKYTGNYKPDNGYNAALGLNLGLPLLPVGVRIEGAYNAFSYGGLPTNTTASADVISGTVNGTFGLGLPYVIGGLGYYSTKIKSKTGSVNDDSERANAMGFNAGVGMTFPLGVLSTFAEIRYHKMTGGDNANTANKPPANLSYIPITFGIRF